jgi:hypothetical protein
LVPTARRPLLADAHCHRHTHAYGLTLTHSDGDCFCETNKISSVDPASGAASHAIGTNVLSLPSTANLYVAELTHSVKALTIFVVFG